MAVELGFDINEPGAVWPGDEHIERCCTALSKASGFLQSLSACPELLVARGPDWPDRVDHFLDEVRDLRVHVIEPAMEVFPP